MTEDRLSLPGDGEVDEATFIKQEKRRSSRKPTRAVFFMSLNESRIEGVGSNISREGAYFITCDEIPVELEIQEDEGERKVFGKIKRIEYISDGTKGIAVQFDNKLPED